MKLHTLAAALLLLSSPALAQEHAGHAMPAEDAGVLPAICLAQASEPMDHGAAPMTMGGDQAHQDLMAGMDQMNSQMMLGGTAEDIDVAFACAMIPHHLGAISMAKAVLEHGDDPWIRSLAETIVAAQEKEVGDMLAWLATQSGE